VKSRVPRRGQSLNIYYVKEGINQSIPTVLKAVGGKKEKGNGKLSSRESTYWKEELGKKMGEVIQSLLNWARIGERRRRVSRSYTGRESFRTAKANLIVGSWERLIQKTGPRGMAKFSKTMKKSERFGGVAKEIKDQPWTLIK